MSNQIKPREIFLHPEDVAAMAVLNRELAKAPIHQKPGQFKSLKPSKTSPKPSTAAK